MLVGAEVGVQMRMHLVPTSRGDQSYHAWVQPMGINMYTVIDERTWNKFLQATHMEAFIIQTYGH